MKIEKEPGQLSAVTVADFILKHYGPMSHLKLQKLLYYSEGYHLAYFGTALIHENFEAWVHGPVCKEVYNELKGHSVLYSDVSFDQASATYNPDEALDRELSSKQKELLQEVLETLSSWKDSELEASTHREKPWIEARQGISPSQKHNGIISKVTMMASYSTEIAKI